MPNSPYIKKHTKKEFKGGKLHEGKDMGYEGNCQGKGKAYLINKK